MARRTDFGDLKDGNFDSLPWIHIYPQFSYHAEVRIVGNAAALLQLADSLREAVENGKADSDGFTADGEGYCIEITRTNHTGLGYTSLPYTAEWCRDLHTDPVPCAHTQEPSDG